MKKLFLLISGTIIGLFSIANAHDMWIEIQGSPKKGEVVSMKMISDHAFPATHNELIPDDQVSNSYMIAPDGKRSDLISNKNGTFTAKAALTKDGTYLIVSGKRPMYWTKTVDGYKPGKNKKEVKGAVKCTYSGKHVKSLVTVGTSGGNAYSQTIGQELEIIPLADPAAISKGGKLPVKVFFKGKPIALDLKATYEGYSTKENEFSQKIKTSSKGECEITLSHAGKWLITLSHREPSKQKDLCDEIMYSATLTFNIR